MCDIKFWKGNENLRSVNKKPFFEILSRFFHFWPLQFSKKLSLLRVENFFSLNRSNGTSKYPSFHTDFKNVHMTLVKSAPKKVLAKKLFYQLKTCPSPKKSVFWAKLFWGPLFTKVICTYLKSVWKDELFDNPFDLIKEKKFYLILGSVCTFYEL
jgi:hypothetical protein